MSYNTICDFRNAVVAALKSYCHSYVLYKPCHYGFVESFIKELETNRQYDDEDFRDDFQEKVYTFYNKMLKKYSIRLIGKIAPILGCEFEVDKKVLNSFLAERTNRIKHHTRGIDIGDENTYDKNFQDLVDPIKSKVNFGEQGYTVSQISMKNRFYELRDI